MVTFLVILLLLDGFFLMGVILLQAGKGGGLAAVGGGASTDNFMGGGRQAATLLTRSTWVASGIFLGLALILAVISSRGTSGPESILQREFQQGPAAAPQPIELPGTGTEGGFEGEEPAGLPGTDAAPVQSGEAAPAQP